VTVSKSPFNYLFIQFSEFIQELTDGNVLGTVLFTSAALETF